MHPEYLDIIVPESVRQKTAAMFFEDFFLFEQPWEFDVRAIAPELQAATHVWHGTGDKQVGGILYTCCEAAAGGLLLSFNCVERITTKRIVIT